MLAAPTMPLPDRAIRDPTYQEALAWLYAFSPTARSAAEIVADRPRKLARTRELLARLDHPERAFASVLVAGTKGKGSTAAMLESIARAAGHRTGLYTQPHLHSWCERTRLGGRPIETGEVVALARAVRAAVPGLERDRPELGRPTTFEVGTALTFLAFARHRVRLAIVEVGVGGAHDATNAVEPLLVVLAPISLDHVATLGGSLEAIAAEKAGLFRPDGQAVVGPQPPAADAVVHRIAAERGSRLEQIGRDWHWQPGGDRPGCAPFAVLGPGFRLDNLQVPLLGRHQRDNATLAVAAATKLPSHPLLPEVIRHGLANVSWPARVQILRERPTVVVDGAHNADSAARLAETLRECFAWRQLHLILGLSVGKDVDGILDALLPLADRLTVTRSDHDRAVPPETLAAATRARGAAPSVAVDPSRALDDALARADPADLVCATGSLFLAAETIEAVGGGRWEMGDRG